MHLNNKNNSICVCGCVGVCMLIFFIYFRNNIWFSDFSSFIQMTKVWDIKKTKFKLALFCRFFLSLVNKKLTIGKYPARNIQMIPILSAFKRIFFSLNFIIVFKSYQTDTVFFFFANRNFMHSKLYLSSSIMFSRNKKIDCCV